MPRIIATDRPQNIADGVVFYYSPNCPYCKTVLPLIDNLENVVSPDTPLYAVDVSGSPKDYGFNTVPTLQYVSGGNVVSQVNDSTLFEKYINRLCMVSRNNYLFC